MKKIIFAVIVCLGCLMFAACDKSTEAATTAGGDSPVGDNSISSADNSAGDGVDLDLTRFSSTMKFAEINNIYLKPDEYLGKTIKLDGVYFRSYYVETGQYYHYVVVVDTLACCSTGMEFSVADRDSDEMFKEEETPITITGVFSSYEEEGDVYYYLLVESEDLVV